MASDGDRSELEQGEDKLWFDYPPIKVDQLIAHGETLTLGDVTLTAHLTYGHTLGCTSWTMGLTGEDGKPHRAVFVCANGVVPNEPLTGERVPMSREGLARLEQIEADIFLGSHGIFFDLSRKRLFQLSQHAQNPFIDPAGFRAFKESVRVKAEAALERQDAKPQ